MPEPNSNDPFLLWNQALEQYRFGKNSSLRTKFELAAKAFYDLARDCQEISPACYEYSTLMDGFRAVQDCRELLEKEDYDAALDSITKAGEIFRTTIHFAFLSPYVAACAGLEVLESLSEDDEDKLQACNNSIALFEQSKIVLSFRDERHPITQLIDAYLLLAISKALQCEANRAINSSEIEDKIERSGKLREDFGTRVAEIGESNVRLNYFPVKDGRRAVAGAFLLAYPDGERLSILNLGNSTAELVELGGKKFEISIHPHSKTSVQLKEFGKIKLRMIYEDSRSGKQFDEGCISLI